MKPDVDKLLEVMAGQLMGHIGPALEKSYDRSSVGAAGVMLLAVREEFERAASRRVDENEQMRAIFADAAPVVADAPLRARLEAVVADAAPGLEISVLEAANASMRGLLVELHAHVEVLDSPDASRIDEAIWRELARSTERRKLSFAVF